MRKTPANPWWRRLDDFFKIHRWFIVLFGLTFLIALVTFKSELWLTGWDTLHPEFNFPLNLSRMIDGTWRTDQGLGALAAHSHMSDLPRVIVLWLMSLVFPIESVKFIFILICLMLGPLGVYAFAYTVLPKGRTKKSLISDDFLAFSAGLFYLCNLGTVQHFYVVFEMFAVQFASIGWLFWLAILYVQKKQHFLLAAFGLVAFLATPMAYASTLWLALAAGLTLFLLMYALLLKSKTYLLRSLVILGIFVLVNAFWLFPNIYYLMSPATSYPTDSHINELFSPEAFFHNQAYGNLKDFAILKNFLFNWVTYSYGNNQFSPLLLAWTNHLEQPFVLFIGYVVFSLGLAGVYLSLKHKQYLVISLLPILALTTFMLVNENPPLGFVYHFLRTHISLFEEGLRMPFTKFSILHMFVLSIFSATALTYLNTLFDIKKSPVSQKIAKLIMFSVTLGMIWYFWPAFAGELISPKMKREIPIEYFDLFTFAKNLPATARIAQLPLQTHAGWDFHSWGYEGPGFIWFGLKQPLLVRDFDRWNPTNETFYNQASQALYNENMEQFASVLDRFDVSYILLDSSIITPSGDPLAESNRTKKLMDSSAFPAIWSSGSLTLYDVRTTISATDTPALSLLADNRYARIAPQVTSATFFDAKAENDPDVMLPFLQLSKDRALEAMVEDGTKLQTSLGQLRTDSIADYSLSFPQNIPITTSAIFTFVDGMLVADFAEPLTMKIGNTVAGTVGTIADLNVPVQATSSSIIVGVNDVFTTLAQGEKSKPIIFSLSPSAINYLQLTPFDESRSLAEQISNRGFWQKQTITLMDETTNLVYSISHSATISLEIPQSNWLPIPLAGAQSANCDVFKRGTATANLQDDSLLQRATQHGAVCSILPLTSGAPGDGLIIRISGFNTQGKSVKLSVRNALSGRNELEHLLPSGPFDEYFTILNGEKWLESSSDARYPYAITLETRSLGQNSENIIEKVQISPLSTSLLSQIQLINLQPDPIHSNNGEQVSRITNSHFAANFLQTAEPQLLPLSQSHDPGWVAFPSWQPWQQFEHVVYNGWANAWIIPPTSNGESNQIRVTMLYWPQLLSYAGYGLLLATLLWLGVGAWRERTSSNSADADEQMYSETISERAVGAGGATPTPHFTPLSIEKLFTGGSLGADFNREWKLFQKEVVSNTLLISHDLQSAWHRVQHAVRKVLRGRKF